MSGLKGMSIAESIVWLFEERVTEAHRSAIEYPLKINEEQFESCIGRARDIGIERGLRLTPIYDRDGWWTCVPTERIAAIALVESVKRNLAEARRNARVYDSFGSVGTSTRFQEAALTGSLSAVRAELPEIDYAESSDYILTRVDEAQSAKKGYVAREATAVA